MVRAMSDKICINTGCEHHMVRGRHGARRKGYCGGKHEDGTYEIDTCPLYNQRLPHENWRNKYCVNTTCANYGPNADHFCMGDRQHCDEWDKGYWGPATLLVDDNEYKWITEVC
jgi:hypothetical protein